MHKILFEQTTKPRTGTFQIRERNTKGMKGTQDQFSMYVIYNIFNTSPIEYSLGSHPSLEGAKKFARNKGLI